MLDQNDLNLFRELLDEKLEQKLEEHTDRRAMIINEAFQAQEEWIREEFSKMPTRNELLSHTDKRVSPLELDMDKVKYIHRKEWKNLPNQRDISASLTADGLK